MTVWHDGRRPLKSGQELARETCHSHIVDVYARFISADSISGNPDDLERCRFGYITNPHDVATLIHLWLPLQEPNEYKESRSTKRFP